MDRYQNTALFLEEESVGGATFGVYDSPDEPTPEPLLAPKVPNHDTAANNYCHRE